MKEICTVEGLVSAATGTALWRRLVGGMFFVVIGMAGGCQTERPMPATQPAAYTMSQSAELLDQSVKTELSRNCFGGTAQAP